MIFCEQNVGHKIDLCPTDFEINENKYKSSTT